MRTFKELCIRVMAVVSLVWKMKARDACQSYHGVRR